MAHLAALAHILELDALDLDVLEALADDHMGAEIGARRGRGEGDARPTAARHDADAAAQQADGRPDLGTLVEQVRVHAGGGIAVAHRGVAKPARDGKFRALVEPYDRVAEVDGITHDFGDRQLFRMAGQIVGRGDDDLVLRLQVRRDPPAIARGVGELEMIEVLEVVVLHAVSDRRHRLQILRQA